MAIAKTQKEKDKQATEDLANKLIIESYMGLSLRRLFREMGHDYAAEYSNKGIIISPYRYEKDLTGILRDSYRKAVNKFSVNIRKDIDQKIPLRTEHMIDDKLKDFFLKHSERQTGFILDTTNNYLNSIIAEVLKEAEEENRNLKREDIADRARKKFTEVTKNHTETIAITETNTASEKSKNTEAEELSDEELGLTAGGIVLAHNLQKEWRTTLDDKTRLAHVAADGQKVNVINPYIVDGEQLMFPSDMSLGASIANIINCRCSSVIIL